MKKKVLAAVIICAVAAVLIIPFRKVYEDGGTKEYSALLYKVVSWNRLTDTQDIYRGTSVYLPPDSFKSVDDLWQKESHKMVRSFMGKLIETDGNTALVEVLENEPERSTCDRISLSAAGLENIGAKAGDVLEIRYTGEISESSPAIVQAVSWKLSENYVRDKYAGSWIDKGKVSPEKGEGSMDVVISEIFGDCFFAESVIPIPHRIKFNGVLSDEWCVGDQVLVTYRDMYIDDKSERMEAVMESVAPSTFEAEPGVCYKPVIYLYPPKETDVEVQLELNGKLTCTYPQYDDGWKVSAAPDGTLTDSNGMTYNYLYWEGENHTKYDFSNGFCVKGEDTAAFLEDALKKLGLTRREANEFIVYWLPLMQDNPYNIISFQTDAYTDSAVLDVEPAPDTVIRVFMAWKSSDAPEDIREQELNYTRRSGFTVVEWGGTEVKE